MVRIEKRLKSIFVVHLLVLILIGARSVSLGAAELSDAGDVSLNRKPHGSVVVTTSLKLRKGPGTRFAQVDTLMIGEVLTVLEKNEKKDTIEEKDDFWYRLKKKNGVTGWAFGAFLQTAAPSPEVDDNVGTVEPPPTSSDIRPINETVLGELLVKRGFEIPNDFKALLIEIVTDETGHTVYYPMDYRGTSRDRDGWWPASTVKLYAAVAALEKLRALGFTPKAALTFQYDEAPLTQSMETLIRRAITDSKNPEFDRLVEFVGARRLNRYFLIKDNGIEDTVMMRCYSGRVIDPETGKCTNRHSPPIIVVEGEKEKHLSEQNNDETYACERGGNCTTLRDLTEVLRRVMMQETLPKAEQYKLGKAELSLLRSALKGTWARGGVNDGLRAVFKGRPMEIFHKGGYADRWFSDNIFLKINDTKERWIIAMVNRPGRESLNQAALYVAALIADGTLSEARKQSAAREKETPVATAGESHRP